MLGIIALRNFSASKSTSEHLQNKQLIGMTAFREEQDLMLFYCILWQLVYLAWTACVVTFCLYRSQLRKATEYTKFQSSTNLRNFSPCSCSITFCLHKWGGVKNLIFQGWWFTLMQILQITLLGKVRNKNALQKNPIVKVLILEVLLKYHWVLKLG